MLSEIRPKYVLLIDDDVEVRPEIVDVNPIHAVRSKITNRIPCGGQKMSYHQHTYLRGSFQILTTFETGILL